MEYLDIVDENGQPTGESVERKKAHREGIPHRTAHVWIFRRREGRLQVLLQKRCMQKDSFPGCYDISSAGHIPAGSSVEESAIRECKEELGLTVASSELKLVGSKHIIITDEFRNEPYEDNQYSTIFVLVRDVEESQIICQPEEIESVMWMDYEEAKKAVVDKTIPNCIDIDELAMLEAYV